jgi:hypothetical protein
MLWGSAGSFCLVSVKLFLGTHQNKIAGSLQPCLLPSCVALQGSNRRHHVACCYVDHLK